MKMLLSSLFKVFSSIVGMTIGLFFAVVLLFSLIIGVSSGMHTPGFNNIADGNGEIKDLGKTAPIIAVIDIQDVIASSKHTADTVKLSLESLDKAPYKGRVKALLINMDCPGGEIFEIYRSYALLKNWKEKTKLPIHVFVNGLCASGGYYIACTADKIVTSQAALIGSVGVLSGPYFNIKEFLNKHGVQVDLLTAGENKAPMNPYTTWDNQERNVRQEIVDFFYEQFISVVMDARSSITKDILLKKVGARLLAPQKALKYGFIDAFVFSKEQAISELAKLCEIEDNYRVIGHGSGSVFKRVLGKAFESPLFTGNVRHEITFADNHKNMLPCMRVS